jgi:hypothetical protein
VLVIIIRAQVDHSPSEAEQGAFASLVEELGTDFATVRVTETMLKQSIIDAHAGVQLLLMRASIDGYAWMQKGGHDGGAVLEASLLSSTETKKTRVSLSRPQAKSGDPQFWPDGLSESAKVDDLLVLIATSRGLIFAVISATYQPSQSKIQALAVELGLPKRPLNSAAWLLTEKVQGIQKKGWIDAVGHGPRCVGETFERELDLHVNSYSRPDFMGEIEIKVSRTRSSNKRTSLQTLVSFGPKWNNEIASTRDLVAAYGKCDPKKEGRKSLYCSVSVVQNSFDLRLRIDVVSDAILVQKAGATILHFSIAELSHALETKHPATLFVSARTRRVNTREIFHYYAARYCERFSALRYLEELAAGNACVDFTAHLKDTGAARCHGYLWRIKSDFLESVFAYRRDLVEPADATEAIF